MEILSEVQAGIKDEIALICTLVKKKNKGSHLHRPCRAVSRESLVLSPAGRAVRQKSNIVYCLFFFLLLSSPWSFVCPVLIGPYSLHRNRRGDRT